MARVRDAVFAIPYTRYIFSSDKFNDLVDGFLESKHKHMPPEVYRLVIEYVNGDGGQENAA